MPETTRIGIAVVEHGGRYLVGRRPTGVALAGKWEFPGGKLQPGESPAEAAVRECREETGLGVEIVGQFPPHTETYDHGTVELHFFDCRVINESLPTSPFQWIERTSLADLDFPSGNRDLLRILLGHDESSHGALSRYDVE